MQRTIDNTIIRQLITKYENRADDCLIRYYTDKDILEEAQRLKETSSDTSTWMEYHKEERANKDILYMSSQLGVYECILKDLKKLVGEENTRLKNEEEIREIMKNQGE